MRKTLVPWLRLALPLSSESHLISTHHSPHLNHPKPEKFPPTPAADVSRNCSHLPPSCLSTSSWRFFPGPLKCPSLTGGLIYLFPLPAPQPQSISPLDANQP